MLASMLFGVSSTWEVANDRGVTKVARGTITGTTEGVSIVGFLPDGETAPYRDGGSMLNDGETLFVLADVSWTDTKDVRHHGAPIACLPPGGSGQRVELGIVENYHASDSRAVLRKIVVSVRCLSP